MLLDKLLSGAVKLWLASQLSNVEKLKVEVPAKEKQILRGYIPQVLINATQIIYQNLYLSTVEIEGTNIRFNLAQVLQKKPLQLLEPIVVKIKVALSLEDARNSLHSSLLQSGLTEIATNLLEKNYLSSYLRSYPGQVATRSQSWQWEKIAFAESIISFQGNSKSASQNNSIQIETKVDRINSHTLLLVPQAVLVDTKAVIDSYIPVKFDLGQEVTIDKLLITPQQLSIEGTITVFP